MTTIERTPAIIYEDSVLLVVDKPAGLTVNRADTTRGEITVQDWVENRLPIFQGSSVVQEDIAESTVDQGNSRDYPSDFFARGGIVHRLDKETSGILLIAKTQQSFDILQQQFRDRVVKKTYLALAHGEIRPFEGEVHVPVGRLEFNRKRFGVVAGGRESLTYYTVIGLYSSYDRTSKELFSLVSLSPQTGRTHQIRVHLKYLNHPIISDELYGGRKTAREDRKHLSRLFLHASEIRFFHPMNRKEMEFQSPLASDLQVFLGTLSHCLK